MHSSSVLALLAALLPLAAGQLSTAIEGIKTTYDIVEAGEGEPLVKVGTVATLHATGTVEETGKKFWSTKDAGQSPFKFTAGINQVIKGWDKGCLGMRLNEKRKLRIPAEEGYGEGGFPAWGIPAGATLVFDLELLGAKGPYTKRQTPDAKKDEL